MLQTINCDQCGGSSIGFNSIHVNVEFVQSSFCPHCQHSKETKKHYFFCSKQCFQDYILRVVKKEVSFN